MNGTNLSPSDSAMQTSSWTSYPKVFNLGHGAVRDIWMKTVLIEEKVDGSQFSFGNIDGRLRIKSKNQDISDIVGEYGLFTEAIAYVRSLFEEKKLTPGYTYRGEVLQNPCHVKLAYDRVPKHHILGFDVCTGNETYLSYADKMAAFARLDLETVPYFFYGIVANPETVRTLLDRRPLLGGKMIEGFVIKAYGVYGEDKKTLMAKYVQPAYREIKDTGENQRGVDLMTEIIETYRSEARWEKAIAHFKEQGKLQSAPQDIGPLVGEITRDLKEECGALIAARLMKRYWPHIARGCTGGFAEWYKRKLFESSISPEAFLQDDQKADVQVDEAPH